MPKRTFTQARVHLKFLGRKHIAIVLALFLILLPTVFGQISSSPTTNNVSASSDDWPTFQHDSAHSGYSTSQAPLTNQTLWNFTTGGAVKSSPVVANGLVYFGSDDGYLYALNAYNGTEIWRYNTYGPVESAATVLDGVVYVGGFHSHAVFALNAYTGALIWNSPVASAGLTISSTLVANGLVYVDVFMYSSNMGGELYALNASTGVQVWNYQPIAWISSSPALWNDIIYITQSTGDVTALNATSGDLIWSSHITNSEEFSSPTLSDGMVYVGTQDELIYALNALTGKTVWTHTLEGGADSCSAVANGRIYVATTYGGNSISGVHAGGVCALEAITGISIWNTTIGSIMNSSPTVADGVVFVGSDDIHPSFLPSIGDGHSVYALNATTGSIIWSFSTGGAVDSSPAIASGVVYVGSDDGNVYAFGQTQATQPSSKIPEYPAATALTLISIASVTLITLKNEKRFHAIKSSFMSSLAISLMLLSFVLHLI